MPFCASSYFAFAFGWPSFDRPAVRRTLFIPTPRMTGAVSSWPCSTVRFVYLVASLMRDINIRKTPSNPTGINSVTASVTHRTGLPGHDRVMNSPRAMHTTAAIHHSRLCVVKCAIRPTSTTPPDVLRKRTRYRYARVPNENNQIPSNAPSSKQYIPNTGHCVPPFLICGVRQC